MHCRKISVIMTVAIAVLMPFVAHAQQISPNPNTGTITVNTSGVYNSYNSSNPFINDDGGVIEITATGTLTNNSGGWIENIWSVNIDSGGWLINSGMLYNRGAQLYNYGTLINNSSGTLFNSGMMDNGSGGTLNNSGTLSSESLLNYGTLNNSGTMTSSWTYNYSSGTLNNSGTLTLGNQTDNEGTLTNNSGGTLNNNDVFFNYTSLTNNSGGTLVNSPGGTLNNYNSLYNYGSLINNGPIFNNGTVINSGIITGTGNFIQTAGQTINNGSMTQASIQINGGILSGAGTITAPVTIGSGASVQPGSPSAFGTVTINGNLTSSGNYTFKIGGANNTGNYDVLQIINGIAGFNGGTIDFNFINGYKAVAGDDWNFLLAKNITGWSTVSFNVTGLGSGLGYQVDPTASGEMLLITASQHAGSPVPIPGTVWLLGSGLVGLIGLKRKYLG